MKFMKSLLIGAVVSVMALTSGCAAIGTAVAHGNLQTKTMMSKSIFLDPVPDRDKVVYIQVRNTTDKPGLHIRQGIREALEDKGYRVTTHFQQAYYVLQVNILRFGKSSQTAAEEMMGAGYGGALEGATAGAYMAAAGGHDPVAGGIIGGIAGTIIDNAVKDVTFSGVSDVKITVRSHPVRRFRTRIVSTADQVNLKFASAEPTLVAGLVKSISGIF